MMKSMDSVVYPISFQAMMDDENLGFGPVTQDKEVSRFDPVLC